jgi:hypothetical protein
VGVVTPAASVNFSKCSLGCEGFAAVVSVTTQGGEPIMRDRSIIRAAAWRVITVLACTSYLAGCSFFGSSSQNFMVSSDPPGATVLINGSQVGTTPLQQQVPRRGDLMVEVQKQGYKAQYRSTSRKLSSLGMADVIGGAFLLLPLLGLFAPAAWEQDPSAMGISLEPATVPASPAP